MRRGLALALAFAASGAAAEAELPFSPRATEACLAGAPGLPVAEVCVGLSAAACIDTPDGYTTVGMSTCLGRERDYWDARLNAAYAALLGLHARSDAELRELGSAAPPTAEALRAMQRAWIGWRDAACGYERSLWGGGTGGGPASVDCAMRATARQALALEARLAALSAQ